jgi:hypothetical protein
LIGSLMTPGGDVLVVEVLEELEAHDVLVPAHPVVHLAQLDVAHAVVHVFQAARVRAVVVVEGERTDGREAGEERAAGAERLEVVLALAGDERVYDPAVGLDARPRDRPLLATLGHRLVGRLGAVPDRLAVGGLRVGHREGDVLGPVTVSHDLLLGGVVLAQTGREQETDVALGEEEARLLARAGGQVGELIDAEAEAMRVEVRGLPGVADIESNVIHIDQPQRIAAARCAVWNRRWSARGGHT